MTPIPALLSQRTKRARRASRRSAHQFNDAAHGALLQIGAVVTEGKAPAGIVEDELAACFAGV
eukprot:8553130-Pyramimonas_sp.AAC.1